MCGLGEGIENVDGVARDGLFDTAAAAPIPKPKLDPVNRLGQFNVKSAKESERGIVDIETLTQTNQTLIDTLDEVMKIQDEGRVKRAEAEQELARIEDQMRNKILEVSKVRQ